MEDQRSLREIFNGISIHEKHFAEGFIYCAQSSRFVIILYSEKLSLYIVFIENFFINSDSPKESAIAFTEKILTVKEEKEGPFDEFSTLHLKNEISMLVTKRQDSVVVWRSGYDEPIEEWHKREELNHRIDFFVEEILTPKL